MTRTSSSALEEIRTPNLLIRSNHAYCDVLNAICAVQPTGRANRTRNSQMLSVRRPRALYGATYGARSITAWLIAGSQRSRSSGRSTITPPNHYGPVTSSHRCLVSAAIQTAQRRPADPPPSGHGVWWPPVTSPERPGHRSPIRRYCARKAPNGLRNTDLAIMYSLAEHTGRVR